MLRKWIVKLSQRMAFVVANLIACNEHMAVISRRVYVIAGTDLNTDTYLYVYSQSWNYDEALWYGWRDGTFSVDYSQWNLEIHSRIWLHFGAHLALGRIRWIEFVPFTSCSQSLRCIYERTVVCICFLPLASCLVSRMPLFTLFFSNAHKYVPAFVYTKALLRNGRLFLH